MSVMHLPEDTVLSADYTTDASSVLRESVSRFLRSRFSRDLKKR